MVHLGSPPAPLATGRKRSTVADVANHAGVSKATVSAVLNGTANVLPATRQRVLAAVEELDYRPTPRSGGAANAASPRRTGRSVAVLIREADNPFYGEVLAGVRAVAAPRGYTVLVTSSEGDYGTEQQAVRLLHEKDVDGLMVYPVLDDHADLSHLFELRRRNYPFVLLEGVRGLPASLVDVDNRAAARAATEHLIELGHRRLVHFAGPEYSLHTRERLDGVREACSGALVRFGDAHVVSAGAHFDDGYRAALAYFGAADPAARPTGVTCYNDLVAAGVMSALAELGLRVPQDVSVVGFDDIPIARHLATPLTTVHVPKYESGRLAAELLLAQIESSAPGAPALPERRSLEATLVVRASTAPPPASAPNESLTDA
jgi:LacI family transcriptional regulator/LacI family repressor for deo operon, udp, cdd, tsx, nupC, and nupG